MNWMLQCLLENTVGCLLVAKYSQFFSLGCHSNEDPSFYFFLLNYILKFFFQSFCICTHTHTNYNHASVQFMKHFCTLPHLLFQCLVQVLAPLMQVNWDRKTRSNANIPLLGSCGTAHTYLGVFGRRKIDSPTTATECVRHRHWKTSLFPQRRSVRSLW